jgi:hypothetical protein
MSDEKQLKQMEILLLIENIKKFIANFKTDKNEYITSVFRSSTYTAFEKKFETKNDKNSKNYREKLGTALYEKYKTEEIPKFIALIAELITIFINTKISVNKENKLLEKLGFENSDFKTLQQIIGQQSLGNLNINEVYEILKKIKLKIASSPSESTQPSAEKKSSANTSQSRGQNVSPSLVSSNSKQQQVSSIAAPPKVTQRPEVPSIESKKQQTTSEVSKIENTRPQGTSFSPPEAAQPEAAQPEAAQPEAAQPEIVSQGRKKQQLLKKATDLINNTIDIVKTSIVLSDKQQYYIDQLTQLQSYITNKNNTPIPKLFNNPRTKSRIDEFRTNPIGNSKIIPNILSKITSKLKQPEQQSSRPSSAAPQPVSDCTLLDKTLMRELNGNIRVKEELEQFIFYLSNKRYCYHIMRSVGNDYLKQLINYFYFGETRPDSFTENKSLFDNIREVFETPPEINSVEQLVISPNSKKNVLFIFKSVDEQTIQIPRIVSKNYVLVSFMNTSSQYKTTKTESIPENDKREYINIKVTATDDSRIMLNYQYMLFPPAFIRQEGGNKTIKKYRKHNRNKTTKNYN